MIILSWNCRGLGQLPTILHLSDMIKKRQPDLILLSETMIESSRFHPMLEEKGYLNKEVVEPRKNQGGLILCWKRDLTINIVVATHSAIFGTFHHQSSFPWLFGGLYGPPRSQERSLFWKTIGDICRCHKLPVLLIGDMNTVTQSSEKRGGRMVEENVIFFLQNLL